MPIHDWTRVDAGMFHDFHQDWTIEICRTLNRGLLPPDYLAMTDQRVDGTEPDVITVRAGAPSVRVDWRSPTLPRVPDRSRVESDAAATPGGPTASSSVISSVQSSRSSRWCRRATTTAATRSRRSRPRPSIPQDGVSLVIIDLFPPTPRDPAGIHQLMG